MCAQPSTTSSAPSVRLPNHPYILPSIYPSNATSKKPFKYSSDLLSIASSLLPHVTVLEKSLPTNSSHHSSGTPSIGLSSLSSIPLSDNPTEQSSIISTNWPSFISSLQTFLTSSVKHPSSGPSYHPIDVPTTETDNSEESARIFGIARIPEVAPTSAPYLPHVELSC